MVSNRPTQQQLAFDFENVASADVDELQSKQSVSAITKQPALDLSQYDLMEKIVDEANMEKPAPIPIFVSCLIDWLFIRCGFICPGISANTGRRPTSQIEAGSVFPTEN